MSEVEERGGGAGVVSDTEKGGGVHVSIPLDAKQSIVRRGCGGEGLFV